MNSQNDNWPNTQHEKDLAIRHYSQKTPFLGKDMPIHEYKKDTLLTEENGDPLMLYPAGEEENENDLAGRKPYELIGIISIIYGITILDHSIPQLT